MLARLNEIPGQAPHVVARRLGDEHVLLNTQTEAYFTLNAVGTRVWELIDGHRTVPAIVQQLVPEYDVTAAELAADVDELLEALAANHLIVWAADPR